MKVLYIGGTGEISAACVEAAVRSGQQVTVFNRGLGARSLPEGVEHVRGDIADDAAYAALARRGFDAVCQFIAFRADDIRRDHAMFGGRCGQYLFVSSASVYQKPIPALPVAEDTPLGNPFWDYARRKIACERALLDAAQDGTLPFTIVRPSHTYRTRLPSTVIDGNHLAWRMLRGKAVPVHDGGESVWTLTHASDFANAFVALCGLDAAVGESVHITRGEGYTWRSILRASADLLGVDADIVSVPTPAVIAAFPDLAGPLYGDKANSLIFDTRRIEALVPGWRCRVSLADGVEAAWRVSAARQQAGYVPDSALDARRDELLAAHMR